MWKKLFVVLLSLNLLAFVSVLLWFGFLPKTASTAAVVPTTLPVSAANVQLTIGQEAVNAYLSYALDEQKDVQRVLGSAKVSLGDTWDVELGLKLADRTVPCDIVLTPKVHRGDLWLPLDEARIGGVPVPKVLLFYLFKHVPWPNWIVVDSDNQQIKVNLTQRAPASPYHIRALRYSTTTRAMTFLVSIMPKAISSHN